MIKEILGSKYNLIQAPMSGVTTPSLVASVARAGGFGMLAAGDVKPSQLKEWIQETKEKTAEFGVNFFVPRAFSVSGDDLSEVRKKLKPLYEEVQVEQEVKRAVSFQEVEENFFAQVETALTEGVRVFSFIFGIPPEAVVNDIKAVDGIIISTATTVQEAVILEAHGADIIVAQGEAAGGHRGTFLDKVEHSLTDTYELVQMIKEKVSVPVVGSGGIMDGNDIKRMMSTADGVQMGTAFIPSQESAASSIHKEMILTSDRKTTLTTAFTGRHARAIDNKVMADIENLGAVVEYPVQRGLTSGLQQYGKTTGNPEYAMMLAGSGYHKALDTQADKLVAKLVEEAGDCGL